mmetsp:Transcript_32593/g.59761  ORF Transcript_32593/g.59761 Transcript_32593/m.59761 type:complete len:119 (+) Transcript_32593:101-457(+)
MQLAAAVGPSRGDRIIFIRRGPRRTADRRAAAFLRRTEQRKMRRRNNTCGIVDRASDIRRNDGRESKRRLGAALHRPSIGAGRRNNIARERRGGGIPSLLLDEPIRRRALLLSGMLFG